MNIDTVMEIGRQAIEAALMLAGPLLLTALAVGLLVSFFQAATQLNEATLSFIPKLVAVFAMLILAGPWMLQTILDFMRRMLENIPNFIG
ncbi:MAG: flagellar biosynthesis protein FliQ [Zoogloeaceae bacterium]|jgi:flagellar biosynthetic protein FliQ|nr:flagellar biosynthesis protein FliQ [Zoogloeaceae bacterium]